MIKEIYVYGAGGLGKEVKMLIDQINHQEPTWEIKGFIDDDKEKRGNVVIENYKVVGDIDFILSSEKEFDLVLAMGNVFDKEKAYEKIKSKENVFFPNIVHPTAIIEEKTLKLGIGNILATNCVISTNTALGDFNYIHMQTLLAHDIQMGSFNSVFPGSAIAGNVIVGDYCEMGLGSSIKQNVEVGSNIRVGGGSFVMSNLESNYSYLGVPAKKIFKLKELEK
jgi:sugar O-acyltransferase (sialic acid O-acetyltransferase NeuD family)